MKLNSNLLYFLGGVLAAYVVYLAFLKPEVNKTTETTYREEIRYVIKDTTVIRYRDSLRLNLVAAEASKDPAKYDSIRRYEGEFNVELSRFKWKAETLGELSKIEFTPTLVIPEKTVTTSTITKETVITKGLFIGGGVSSNLDFNAGAYYLNRNKILGYEYDPVRKTHGVKFALKIF